MTHVHLTGGAATHDMIISERNFKASLTAELGCITPWIVVPDTHEACAEAASIGKQSDCWTPDTVRRHARHIVTAVKANGSANCLAPKAVILSDEWAFRDLFLEELRKAMKDVKSSGWYYPGTEERFNQFVAAYGTEASETFATRLLQGKRAKSALLFVHLDEKNEGGNRYALQHEAFAPVLAVIVLTKPPPTPRSDAKAPGQESPLPDPDPAAIFLHAATQFCNESIAGTLSCSVICPNPTGPICDSLEVAIARLEYGCVCVNLWSAFAYGISQGSWGAYPGKYERVAGGAGSGCGIVGNCLLQADEDIMKTVVRAPFVHSLQPTGDLPSQGVIDMLTAAARTSNMANAIVAVLGTVFMKMFWNW